MCAQGRPDEDGYGIRVLAGRYSDTHLLPRFAVDPAPGRPLPFPEGERPAVPEDLLRRDALALRALV